MTILATNACLVVFKVSQWTARKLDKSATAKTLSDAGAASTAGSFHKQLVGKAALQTIAAVVNEARAYHYAATLPWLDDGPRILPAAKFTDYMDRMDTFEASFREAADAFADNYESYVQDARSSLGKLFRETDYPASVRGLFAWECTAMGMPDASDFRAQIPAAAVERVKAEMEKRTQDAMVVAVRDVFERVLERVRAMSDKLANYKPASDATGASGVFRDSLVDNMRDLVDALPSLNITGDARITALTETMADLCKWDATTLRESDTLRRGVQAKAAKMVADVSAFMA